MALTQTMTTSFKAELPQAVHNLLSNTIQMALYTSAATLNADTTVYTTDNEVVASGYTAGGVVLTGVTINTANNVAYISFNNPVFNAALTARGALIYNVTAGGKSIAVLDFGADKISNATFTVTLPPNTSNSAVLRIA
jgi:endonuclease/exonuclease/phosphatase family metal-dependent hydrolase